MKRRQTLPVIMQGLYEALDPLIEERARVLGATCQPGCTHCCHQIVVVLGVEAVTIADALLRWIGDDDAPAPRFLDIVKRLRAHALEACYVGITEENYFQQQIPCVFLEAGRCVVYAQRPGACRYHLVVTDPMNCALGGTGDGIIHAIDMEPFRKEGQRVEMQALPAQVFGGPLSLSVLACLADARPPTTAAGRAIHDAYRGLGVPLEWIGEYGQSLSGSSGTPAVDEDTIG